MADGREKKFKVWNLGKDTGMEVRLHTNLTQDWRHNQKLNKTPELQISISGIKGSDAYKIAEQVFQPIKIHVNGHIRRMSSFPQLRERHPDGNSIEIKYDKNTHTMWIDVQYPKIESTDFFYQGTIGSGIALFNNLASAMPKYMGAPGSDKKSSRGGGA
jgi:hypothetical protein